MSLSQSQGLLSGNRFEALSDLAGDSEGSGGCYWFETEVGVVVLDCRPSCPDHEWDPDTESIEGVFDVEEDVSEASVLETPVLAERIQARARSSGQGVRFWIR